MRHSVLLMDEVDAVLHECGLTLPECDLLACVVGPGSFTGIRIGIAAVKGMCLACSRPALAITSFDALAYADRSGTRTVLIDAGHGAFYACPYEGDLAGEAKYVPAGGTFSGKIVTDESCDRARGLLAAVPALAERAAPAERLAAFYLRKSAAEEGR